MYLFVDAITFRYSGAPASALDRLSLFVRSGEIAAVVGPADAGKTTLLRYVSRRSDGSGGVFLGSETDESGRKTGLILAVRAVAQRLDPDRAVRDTVRDSPRACQPGGGAALPVRRC